MDSPVVYQDNSSRACDACTPAACKSSDDALSVQSAHQFEAPGCEDAKPAPAVEPAGSSPPAAAPAQQEQQLVSWTTPAPWINLMLRASFFSPCETHKHMKKNECTYFCATCATDARSLCQHCMHEHRGHQVIQIRRYVYCDVVRATDINQHVDVTGVQAYIINQAKVVFLNPRPQAKLGNAAESDCCRTCSRTLREGFSYCCVACKVNALQRGVADNDLAPAAATLCCEAPRVAAAPKASTSGRRPRTPSLNDTSCAVGTSSRSNTSDEDGSSCEADDVFVCSGAGMHPAQLTLSLKRQRLQMRGTTGKRWSGSKYADADMRVRQSSESSSDSGLQMGPAKLHRRKGMPCRSPH